MTKIYKYIFCFINSLIGLFAIKFHYNTQSLFVGIDGIYLDKFEFKDIFIFIVLLGIWLFFFYLLDKFINKKRKKIIFNISKKKLFIISLIVLLVLWSPYYLTFFPGGVYTDTFTEFHQAINGITGNGHNIFYILYIRLLYYLSFKNTTVMFGIMTIIQLVLFLFIFSYFIVWLKNKNVDKRVVITILLFFGLYPRIPIYALSLWKDSLFNIFLFLYVLYLYDIISSNGLLLKEKKNVIRYIILSILVSLFRNNGFYIILIISIILFFKYKKLFKKLKLFYISSISLCLVLIFIFNILFKVLGYNPPYREAIGMSLQQISYVYVKEDINNEFINDLFDLSEYKLADIYSPMISDPIKVIINNDFLEKNKSTYWKYYFKYMRQYPGDYFKESLFVTVGYWNYYSVVFNAASDSLVDFNNNKDNDISNNINVLNRLFGIDLSNSLKKLAGRLNNCAFSNLIVFISLYILLYKKKLDRFIIYLPSLFIFIILLVGTPIAFSSRYIIYTIFFIPLSLLIPFIDDNRIIKRN